MLLNFTVLYCILLYWIVHYYDTFDPEVFSIYLSSSSTYTKNPNKKNVSV